MMRRWPWSDQSCKLWLSAILTTGSSPGGKGEGLAAVPGSWRGGRKRRAGILLMFSNSSLSAMSGERCTPCIVGNTEKGKELFTEQMPGKRPAAVSISCALRARPGARTAAISGLGGHKHVTSEESQQQLPPVRGGSRANPALSGRRVSPDNKAKVPRLHHLPSTFPSAFCMPAPTSSPPSCKRHDALSHFADGPTGAQRG